ncbi:MAG: hypothetical protein JOZ30_16690, partial [Hyphomicrobiales bacterium]|nr:hypothetical protein [Hyphomicrobiales bacterium]
MNAARLIIIVASSEQQIPAETSITVFGDTPSFARLRPARYPRSGKAARFVADNVVADNVVADKAAAESVVKDPVDGVVAPIGVLSIG